MEKGWEVGSEFDWSNDFLMASKTNNFLPKLYELFPLVQLV